MFYVTRFCLAQIRTHPGRPGHRYTCDSGVLSSVNLLKNNVGEEQMQNLLKIKREKGMVTLCGLHQGQTQADFSNQGLGASDAKLIASDIQDMGALSKLTFSGDDRRSKPVTVEVGMTEADFSGAILQSSGARILATWLELKAQLTNQTKYCFGLITFAI